MSASEEEDIGGDLADRDFFMREDFERSRERLCVAGNAYIAATKTTRQSIANPERYFVIIVSKTEN